MNKGALFQKENKTKFLVFLGLFTLIILLNMLTLAQPINLVVTIPQFLIVILFLFAGDYRNATLLHFCFFILSLSAQKTLGLMADQVYSLYNYGTVKLIGPIRASYAMNIVLVLICIFKGIKPRKDILFYKLYRYLLYMTLIAVIIGLIGIIINPYYTFLGFENPAIYMFVVLTTCYVLLCFASNEYIKSCYYLALISTMAGIFASYIAYSVFGIVSSYSIFDIVYCADAMWFAAILIAGVLFIKEKTPLYAALFVLALIYLNVMEGKTVINLSIALLCLIYYVYIDKETISHHRVGTRVLRPILLVGCILGATKISLSDSSMALYKIQSAISIFSADSLEDMSTSPYIRFASLANVLNEEIHNPFTLLFGNGFGGYFEDKLNLFAGLDLSKGAWTDEIIRTGRFPNGHDTMVNVPFYNGLLGVFLIIKICFLYIKRIKFNFMNCVAFMWIFLMFYFNTIFAVMGSLFLLGAEYDINGYNKRQQSEPTT